MALVISFAVSLVVSTLGGTGGALAGIALVDWIRA